MCAFSNEILGPKITKPNVAREKLPKRLTYEKGAHKMLMKFTPETHPLASPKVFLL